MLVTRYLFDLVDTDGTTKQVEEAILTDVAAVLDRVSQIGSKVERPGCRIRVRDGKGSVVFVGVTTGTAQSTRAV
jgi:hypothetical protein